MIVEAVAGIGTKLAFIERVMQNRLCQTGKRHPTSNDINYPLINNYNPIVTTGWTFSASFRTPAFKLKG